MNMIELEISIVIRRGLVFVRAVRFGFGFTVYRYDLLCIAGIVIPPADD